MVQGMAKQKSTGTASLLPRGNGEKSLALYLREIGKYPLLSATEEVDLARRAKTGDRQAIDRLTAANLRFVVGIAKEYQNRGLSLADLINEGNVGLLKAIKRFDETKGIRFLSYAVWWIRQSILHSLAEQVQIVHLPPHRRELLTRINQTSVELEQKEARPPTNPEIAKKMKMSPEVVEDLLASIRTEVSLDAPLSEGGQLRDIVEDEWAPSPDHVVMERALSREIQKALGTLTPRESSILRWYYGFEGDGSESLESIGNRLNLSRERVRQLKERAMAKLRGSAQSGRLRAYLN
jgi:RNA polymerase primary sigma factor